jgi:Putative MetA-pathway of phenol degradation
MRCDHSKCPRLGQAFVAALLLATINLSVASHSAIAQQASAAQDPDYNGEDFTRPVTRFDFRFEYNASPGSGPTPGSTQRVDTEVTALRAQREINLDARWKLGLLAELPVVVNNGITSDNPFGDTMSGLGDAFFQAALVTPLNDRWAVGFGGRMVAPTATDRLGSGRWQIMPGFGVRYSITEWGPDSYFVPVLRYAVSFAGDPSRRNISEPQFAPTLNIGLPNRWFVALFPSNDIRINFGDPVTGQTGRLFLPFDISVGRKLTDNIIMSLEVSVPIIKDYPVYDFKTEAKIGILF